MSSWQNWESLACSCPCYEAVNWPQAVELIWEFSAKPLTEFGASRLSFFHNRNNVLTALPEEMEALKRLHTINLAFNR